MMMAFWSRKRNGRSRGSTTLESTLVIALLILVASATTVLLGDAIACLFLKESSRVVNADFYTQPLAFTVGEGDATVAWGGDAEGPYIVLRGRPTDQGFVEADLSTWTSLGTFLDSPATDLTIAAGDLIAVAAEGGRCGYGLLGGSQGPPPAPYVPTSADSVWYAASATLIAADSSEEDWVVAYSDAFDLLWERPASDAGMSGVSPEIRSVAIGGDLVYSSVVSPDATAMQSGVYSWPLSGEGTVEPVSGTSVLVDDAGTRADITGAAVSADADGSMLLLVTASDGVVYMDTADLYARVVSPTGTSACFGLDGTAYVLEPSGGGWDIVGLASSGLPESRVPVPGNIIAEAGSADISLASVDAVGDAWLEWPDGQAVVRSTGGEILPAAGRKWGGAASDSFTRDGVTIGLSGTAAATYRDLAGPRTDASILASPAWAPVIPTIPSGGKAELTSLSSLTGEGNIAPPAPTPPPPSGEWKYTVLVNGREVFSETFTPADPDSVTFNGFLASAYAGDPYVVSKYGRDLGGGSYELPVMRVSGIRIAVPDASLDSRSNAGQAYAYLPGAGRFTSWAGGIRTALGSTPAAGFSNEGLVPGFDGDHSDRGGDNWGQVAIQGHGHAYVTGSVAEVPSGMPANGLCTVVVHSIESDYEVAGTYGREYWVRGGVGPHADGTAERYAVNRFSLPLASPGAYADDGPSDIAAWAGRSLASFDLEVMGVTWDGGDGFTPNLTFGIGGSDPSFPDSSSKRGLLVRSDTGETVTADMGLNRVSSIEVIVQGGDVAQKVTDGTQPPNSAPRISPLTIYDIHSNRFKVTADAGDIDGDTVTRKYIAKTSGTWPTQAEWDAASAFVSPQQVTGLSATTGYWLYVYASDSSHPTLAAGATVTRSFITTLANALPTISATTRFTTVPSSTGYACEMTFNIADDEGDAVNAEYYLGISPTGDPTSELWPSSFVPARSAPPASPLVITYGNSWTPGSTLYLRYFVDDAFGSSSIRTDTLVVPVNGVPTADVTASVHTDPSAATNHLEMSFTLGDPEGDRLIAYYMVTTDPNAVVPTGSSNYLWGSGSYTDPPAAPILKTYNSMAPGTQYYIKYYAYDRKGNSTGTLTVPVWSPANAAPTVTTSVTSMSNNGTTAKNVRVTFVMSDPEGDLSNATCSWSTTPGIAPWTTSTGYVWPSSSSGFAAVSPTGTSTTKTMYMANNSTYYVRYEMHDIKGNSTGIQELIVVTPGYPYP